MARKDIERRARRACAKREDFAFLSCHSFLIRSTKRENGVRSARAIFRKERNCIGTFFSFLFICVSLIDFSREKRGHRLGGRACKAWFDNSLQIINVQRTYTHTHTHIYISYGLRSGYQYDMVYIRDDIC